MARQKGILPIEGTIGNITFFKSQDGYMVREKGGVSADKIANDPAFARTRENNAEFGRAGKASRLLRTALRGTLQQASDSRVVGRLTARMMDVIHEDTVNTRGLRNVIDGEALLLEGFEFNIQGKLGTTLFAPYTVTLNRTTGEASISIPPFVPANLIAAPGGTTHFRFSIAAASIDFEEEAFIVETTGSGYLPLDKLPTAVLGLSVSLPPAGTHPMFLALVVEFVQDVNGTKYPLNNGAFNPGAVIKVDTP